MVSFNAIVLAAGFSERMGSPKALLLFERNQTFIEQVTEIYLTAGAQKMVLVINPSLLNSVQSMPICKKNKVLFVENKEPEKGRMHSIKLGLEPLDKLPVFIQNVDNPFVTVELIQEMVPVIQPNTYVSPYFQGVSGHPILVSSQITQELMHFEGNVPLYSILKGYKQIPLEQGNSGVLVNINTPGDYRSVFK